MFEGAGVKRPSSSSSPEGGSSVVQARDLNDEIELLIATGRNVGIIGLDSSGKTLSAALMGYLNSRYSEYMDDYPLTKRCISEGIFPEIEKIAIIETQNKFDKHMRTPTSAERHLVG